MKLIIAVLLVSIAFFSTKAQTQPLPKDQDCKTLDEFNFKLCFPKKWRYDDTTQVARFFIFTPSESDTDRFIQNFNLQARILNEEEAKITVKEYAELNLKELKNSLGDFKQLSIRNNVVVKGVKWNEIVYTGKIDGVNYKLKFTQRYTIYKGKAFVITYVSDGERKDIYYARAFMVLNSISL